MTPFQQRILDLLKVSVLSTHDISVKMKSNHLAVASALWALKRRGLADWFAWPRTGNQRRYWYFNARRIEIAKIGSLLTTGYDVAIVAPRFNQLISVAHEICDVLAEDGLSPRGSFTIRVESGSGMLFLRTLHEEAFFGLRVEYGYYDGGLTLRTLPVSAIQACQNLNRLPEVPHPDRSESTGW